MTSGHGGREVGQPVWLPDFVDPADVGEASLEASAAWGEDQPHATGGSAGGASARTSGSSVAPGSRRRGSSATSTGAKRGFADGGSSSFGTARGAKKPKKHLSWAEKQERREARVQRRREEEAAEREKDPLGFAREIVLTQLSAAPKSRAQLAEKLRAKDVDEDVIDAVLDRMEDVGLVDDAAYAGMLVRSQVATRGLARKALARELQRKGIDGEAAQEALDQVDDDSERARALELARKKLATMSRLDPQTQTRRLAGLLARKGYPPSLVWPVIKEVQGSADSEADL